MGSTETEVLFVFLFCRKCGGGDPRARGRGICLSERKKSIGWTRGISLINFDARRLRNFIGRCPEAQKIVEINALVPSTFDAMTPCTRESSLHNLSLLRVSSTLLLLIRFRSFFPTSFSPPIVHIPSAPRCYLRPTSTTSTPTGALSRKQRTNRNNSSVQRNRIRIKGTRTPSNQSCFFHNDAF